MHDRESLEQSLRHRAIDCFPQQLRPDTDDTVPVSTQMREAFFTADEIFVADSADADALTEVAADGWGIDARTAAAGFTSMRANEAGGAGVAEVLDELYRRNIEASANHIFAVPANELSGQPHYQSAPEPEPTGADDIRWAAQPGSGAGLVNVAVLDTGIVEHKWLSMDRDWRDSDRDVIDADADGQRDTAAGHGTFVAGLVTRLASRAHVKVLDVLDGTGWVSESHLAQRLDALEAADVLSLSCGGFTYRNRPPLLLKHAIDGWLDRNPGSVVVAAAGNAGVGRRFWPAALRRVIAVGAVDGHNRPATFTNYGTDDDRWVDACAPAVDVKSTFVTFPPDDQSTVASEKRFEGWATWSGTSFAAPVVAAAIARRIEASGSTITAEQAWHELSHGKPVIQQDGKYLGVLVR